MSLEIRPITDDELERSEFITAYSFNDKERYDLSKRVEESKKFFLNEWSLASFENGEMTAFLRVLPFAIRLNGRALSFGAVGPVVSAPEHRRRGHVGQLLTRALEDMRDRGQVLSGLHTPHPTLYRRYGWEIASARREYRLSTKDIELMAEPGERGRFRMLKAEDWAQADRVYRLHTAKANGALHRGEVWWRASIFSETQPVRGDVALWEDASGEPQGYVVYYQRERTEGDYSQFWVRELVALTSDAYLNLLRFLLRHDLVRDLLWSAPPDDPLLSLVADASKINVREDYDLLLRICDVEGALKQRLPAYAEHPVELTLKVSDASAPWNEGTWRVEVADGETNVEKVSAGADITLSAATLAPLYNGYLSPGGAALAGLISVRDEEALSKADTLFATLSPPYCADGF